MAVRGLFNTKIMKKTVIDYGARGDGLTDDGEAFQRAINEATGTLEVPAGHYLIGRVLRVRSGTHLHLADQARLKLGDGVAKTPGDYMLTNADHEGGNADITIEGGIWDGNNIANARPDGLFDYGCSGALMHFQNVKRLRLDHLHLHDAEAYYIRLTEVSGFHISNIRFSADRIRPNNDGVHLGGHCENGVIEDIVGLHPGVTGDDMVALNADDALKRTEVKGMTCGPIRNIRIEGLSGEGVHSFVRLLSVSSPIENISISRVRGSCEVAALNCDAARGCRVPVFDEANPPYPDGVGLLRNICADDFLVSKSRANEVALLRLETRMERFRITNFRRDLKTDQKPEVPTVRLRHLVADRIELNGDRSNARELVFGKTLEISEANIETLDIN